MIGKILLMLLGICSFILAPAGRIQARQDHNQVEGTWILMTAELAGQKLPDAGLKDTKLILTDGRYSYQNDFGTYKVGSIASPAAPRSMDITGTDGPNKGKTFLAIYQLDGDTLTICYDLAGKLRPSEFSTHSGTVQFLVVYKRAKE